jgi:hypothetical protein
MELRNFELRDPLGCVEVSALGKNWDLHNCVDFLGFLWRPFEDELWMEWAVLAEFGNPWGDPSNHAAACRIRFSGINSIRVSRRKAGLDPRESLTVADIAKVIPGEVECPLRERWGPADAFELRFTFEDEREVTIDAVSVHLEPLDSAGIPLAR